MARPGDLVYMDPPYQGVSNVRDNRYFAGVPFDEFAEAIETLNRKGVDYSISYDGECSGKEYGEELLASLGCKKVFIKCGCIQSVSFTWKKIHNIGSTIH